MTPHPSPTIRRATAEDARRVAALIGEAFQPLTVARWLVPDPGRRADILPANFHIFVDHALTHGEVHVSGDLAAAAVWFPRDGGPLPEPVAYTQRVAAACGENTERFFHLDDLFDAHHPAEPHHHLAFLAVRPDRQRQGLGSMLLAHHHTRLDTAGVAAYLEATSEAARDLFMRHGYQAREPFHLPNGTPMWPMWRPPARVRQQKGES
ncbi:MAG: GNAT family N-acetyltransferase [Natronosporangium sp.]